MLCPISYRIPCVFLLFFSTFTSFQFLCLLIMFGRTIVVISTFQLALPAPPAPTAGARSAGSASWKVWLAISGITVFVFVSSGMRQIVACIIMRELHDYAGLRPFVQKSVVYFQKAAVYLQHVARFGDRPPPFGRKPPQHHKPKSS